MKKSLLIVSTILIVFCIIGIVFFKNCNIGVKDYFIKEQNITLKAPKFLKLKEVKKQKIIFMSFKSEKSLKKSLNSYFKTLEKKMCNYEDDFYDKKNNITYKGYSIEKGGLFNTFTIEFVKGKETIEKCERVTDYKKMKYYIQERSNKINRDWFERKYLWTDNKIYNYYEDKRMYILIKRGRGEYGHFTSLLSSGYISMDTLLKFLEYQTNQGKGEKQEFSNEATIYNIDNLSVLKCTNKNAYNKIYISHKEILDYDNLCI